MMERRKTYNAPLLGNFPTTSLEITVKLSPPIEGVPAKLSGRVVQVVAGYELVFVGFDFGEARHGGFRCSLFDALRFSAVVGLHDVANS